MLDQGVGGLALDRNVRAGLSLSSSCPFPRCGTLTGHEIGERPGCQRYLVDHRRRESRFGPRPTQFSHAQLDDLEVIAGPCPYLPPQVVELSDPFGVLTVKLVGTHHEQIDVARRVPVATGRGPEHTGMHGRLGPTGDQLPQAPPQLAAKIRQLGDGRNRKVVTIQAEQQCPPGRPRLDDPLIHKSMQDPADPVNRASRAQPVHLQPSQLPLRSDKHGQHRTVQRWRHHLGRLAHIHSCEYTSHSQTIIGIVRLYSER